MLHTDNPHESLTPPIHHSAYPPEELERITAVLEKNADLGISSWCIFDNTALGAATADALTVKSQLLESQRAIR
jgi:uncharacterized protein YecE (DUF72 family)